jgi:hypothetical protein
MPAELPWTEALGFDDLGDALAAPIAPAPIAPAPGAPGHSVVESAGAPGLERRVLALERLLQALLARLAKAEPDLLAGLDGAFSASLLSARADDNEAIDSCAAALIHSALGTGGEAAEAPPEVADASPRAAVEARPGDGHDDQLSLRPPPFRFLKVGGIWRLTRNRRP